MIASNKPSTISSACTFVPPIFPCTHSAKACLFIYFLSYFYNSFDLAPARWRQFYLIITTHTLYIKGFLRQAEVFLSRVFNNPHFSDHCHLYFSRIFQFLLYFKSYIASHNFCISIRDFLWSNKYTNFATGLQSV